MMIISPIIDRCRAARTSFQGAEFYGLSFIRSIPIATGNVKWVLRGRPLRDALSFDAVLECTLVAGFESP